MLDCDKMQPEFDRYADHYSDALRHPLLDGFAGHPEFYIHRKFELLRDFYRRRGMDTGVLAWLDLGCGQGDLLRLGKASFAQVAGCDLSGEMLTHCGDLTTRPQPSPSEIPYPTESFDLVTAVCVYHHVERQDRPRLTGEVWRVLRPGGLFSIIEHNPFNPAAQIIVRTLAMDANARLLRLGAARRLMREARFKPVEGVYFLWLPESLYRKWGGIERRLERVPLGGQYALFGKKECAPTP